MVPVNYVAVLVAGIVMMVLGGLWYGPFFGKQWIAQMGWSETDVKAKMAGGMSAMWKSYALMFIGALVMSFVLQHALVFANAYLAMSGVQAGIVVGFANWAGFIAPVMLGMVIWEGKSWKLWFIQSGYYLVSLVLVGILLAVWM